MRGKGELSSALAIALAVSCVLLFDPVNVGFCDYFEDYSQNSTHLLGIMILESNPKSLLGRTKVIAGAHIFSSNLSKSSPKAKKKIVRLQVFTGREAKLNYVILCLLSKAESPLAIWNIFQRIKNDQKGFKRTKYAVVNARVKALEIQGYFSKAGFREKRKGGETNLYEITAHAELAIALNSESLETIVKDLDEPGALAMLSLILSRRCQQT